MQPQNAKGKVWITPEGLNFTLTKSFYACRIYDLFTACKNTSRWPKEFDLLKIPPGNFPVFAPCCPVSHPAKKDVTTVFIMFLSTSSNFSISGCVN
ncbi:MAG: hypothetical protein HYV28_02410 [Ignavibacteriales bacterium]|nr:hypothetical protein [Ignavibacteriales bacterium]